MLFRGHDILDLAEIPRDRPRLQALINAARMARRRSRLMRWAALNVVVWACYVALGAPGLINSAPADVSAAGVSAAAAPVIYLPAVGR